MKILIINGPNLNMLGIREPEHYGNETYSDLENKIRNHCQGKCEIEIKQSNHEGVLVDYIQGAYFNGFDGIVINPAAYTHTSIALLDAVKSVKRPTVEVHISDVSTREDFRQISYIRQACISTVSGKGTNGYLIAIDELINYIQEERK
jgi:3-dehydroquinate dehydratase-2